MIGCGRIGGHAHRDTPTPGTRANRICPRVPPMATCGQAPVVRARIDLAALAVALGATSVY